MQDVFESPPRNALEEAIGPISLAQEKAAMAGGTRRTVQSELASVKTKDTHSSREGCKAEQMNTVKPLRGVRAAGRYTPAEAVEEEGADGIRRF
ncbi:hypothetical protein KPH14_004655 [Odynerus spinipes]|uniref:Uncharacterized protein n=1 Tax=Odynerus spinipes TaxID=1348599 RepID=A0AAD9VPI2_9HYME|nr:hypothetical protein KPH14_004655 [Odynerus spinipes]